MKLELKMLYKIIMCDFEFAINKSYDMGEKMNVNLFLTIQSIIIAGLLAWASLWSHTYDIYNKAHLPVWHVSLAMLGIYLAVLFSLISIALAVIAKFKPKNGIKRVSVSLALFSYLDLVAIVLTSSFGFTIKTIQAWDSWEPLKIVSRLDPVFWFWFAAIAAIFVLAICLFFPLEKIVKWEE